MAGSNGGQDDKQKPTVTIYLQVHEKPVYLAQRVKVWPRFML